MSNEDTRKRVDEIFKEVRALQEELKTVRENCSHDDYRIGNWSWRPGAIMQVRICNHCDDNIGEPTEEEYEKFTQEGGGTIKYNKEE